MKYLGLCITLNILVFSSSVYSADPDSSSEPVIFNVRHVLRFKCNITSPELEAKWEKNGAPIGEIKDLNGRYSIKKEDLMSIFSIPASKEDDIGNYTCQLYDKENKLVKSKEFSALSKTYIKVPDNVNIVEGEKLSIHCRVYGKPYPTIYWTYKNDTSNETVDLETGKDKLNFGERLSFKDDQDNKIPQAILEVSEIQLGDRGLYTCVGKPTVGDEIKSSAMVRIKDKYAALWPFLGICAEVFVLCAIILIYEKKRNKTELEESDTDQSPDQKNTPDHKDSNLRHRQ